MLVIGEIDHADADGYQSVQWEIVVPRDEGADGEHPRWGEVRGRVDICEGRTWNALVEALSTLVQNSLHMSTKLPRTGGSSIQGAADFDQVGSVMGSPSRARRNLHFPLPSPLGLSPASPQFADLMVWLRVKTRFRRAEAARETWGPGPSLEDQSMADTSRTDEDEGRLQTRPSVHPGTPVPHNCHFRLYNLFAHPMYVLLATRYLVSLDEGVYHSKYMRCERIQR